ncbi:CBS domain-containing protein [Streptomyces sp. RKAG337]|uniref:CBS domain-containing protein n=1 Tax=Streptomyces sp. RKAG337 TaxID=2893404 RepID=UPI002033E950|nr:CBS domain-containing protein [Streptomyces sp. RKAG337]MCM2425153.1 CBS domain-containing protein [Streptomyces sp. RKAG337]
MTDAARPTVADAMALPELHVSDHTTIDRALAVLHGARTDHVLIRDDEGHCAGIVTRDQLTAHSAQPWYTEATRVRDIPHDCSPFARPDMPLSEAEATMRERSLAVWPVVDDDGVALGVLTLGPNPRTAA